MFLTTYHDPKPCGLPRQTIEMMGETESQRFDNTTRFIASPALNYWGIKSGTRVYDKTRTSLELLIDGQVDGKISGTHFVFHHLSCARQSIEQASILGHVLLHYLPRMETGEFSPQDGMQFASINEKATPGYTCDMEALYFAFGFLMPSEAVRKSHKDNMLKIHFPLPEAFVNARLSYLGLIT